MGSGHSTDKDRFRVVFIINLAVFCAELAVGLYSGSLTMMSDSFHLAIHVLASIVALGSELKISKLPQDKTKKWAAAINIGLFFILAVLIGHEAWKRLFDPRFVKIDATFFTVAITGLIANLYTVRILHSKFGEHFSENRDILRWEMIYDSVGSLTLIASAIIICFTGFYIIDPIFSMVLALIMIAKSTQMLLRFRNIHNHPR